MTMLLVNLTWRLRVDIMAVTQAPEPTRCRSEIEKNILEGIFSSVMSQWKNYHHSGNLKFNNLGISQSFIFLWKQSFPFVLS